MTECLLSTSVDIWNLEECQYVEALGIFMMLTVNLMHALLIALPVVWEQVKT